MTNDRKIRAPFTSLTVSTSNYNAVLDILTPDTYILVLCSNKIRKFSFPLFLPLHSCTLNSRKCTDIRFYTLEPAAIELNIKLARPHFGSLEGIGLGK